MSSEVRVDAARIDRICKRPDMTPLWEPSVNETLNERFQQFMGLPVGPRRHRVSLGSNRIDDEVFLGIVDDEPDVALARITVVGNESEKDGDDKLFRVNFYEYIFLSRRIGEYVLEDSAKFFAFCIYSKQGGVKRHDPTLLEYTPPVGLVNPSISTWGLKYNTKTLEKLVDVLSSDKAHPLKVKRGRTVGALAGN